MTAKDLEKVLYEHTEDDPHAYTDPNIASLTIHENQVVASNLVDGLHVDVKEKTDGVDIRLTLDDGVTLENPVHLCFGVLPENGVQKINMLIKIGRNAKVSFYAHCTFPFALDVLHLMEAEIHVEEGADYRYFERHVHSDSGGVTVVPKAVVHVAKNARFSTEFELIKGRVGKMHIDYTSHIAENGVVDMNARISGRATDTVKIEETAYLNGEYAKAVLTTKVAVRDSARAEVFNKIIADAPYARGHVDCKEIVMDNGAAMAMPIVDVRNPKAHVTHEAAVGSVDKKQLETLMARGLDEDEASELIIQGMLGQ